MYRDLFSIKDRVVIVTGGTGHLGKEMCKGLAAFGAQVIALGRNSDRFPELLKANQPDFAHQIECRQCDVQDEEAFATVVADVVGRTGRLDALINNANNSKRETWDELNKEAWEAGLDGTLTHQFTCAKAVSPHLLKAGQGSIVNVSSLFGMVGPQFGMYPADIRGPAAHHAAAKAGVLQLTKYLATLWAPAGVRVNAITPGWFPQKRGPERPDFMQEVNSRIPLGRIGQPSDLVGAAVYLVSNASSYMTGQNLVVDGGYTVW
jgi:NAD(P)-dependent dehydrogenase (short-subunit alcohol dehydrogenase family)